MKRLRARIVEVQLRIQRRFLTRYKRLSNVSDVAGKKHSLLDRSSKRGVVVKQKQEFSVVSAQDDPCDFSSMIGAVLF